MKNMNKLALLLLSIAAVVMMSVCSQDEDGSNTAPIASSQDLKFIRGSVDNNISLDGFDADGDRLSYSIVKQPRAGTLKGSGKNISYTPDTNFFGYIYG